MTSIFLAACDIAWAEKQTSIQQLAVRDYECRFNQKKPAACFAALFTSLSPKAVALPGTVQGKLLSEWDLSLCGRVDLRPRLADLSSLKDVKQVDFVSYIPNPQFRRSRPRGEASRLIVALRNRRLQPTSGSFSRCGVSSMRHLHESSEQEFADVLLDDNSWEARACPARSLFETAAGVRCWRIV